MEDFICQRRRRRCRPVNVCPVHSQSPGIYMYFRNRNAKVKLKEMIF